MTWPTKTDFVDGDVLTATQVNNIGTNLNLYDPTSATTGQIPIADGAGSVAFGTISAGGMTLLSTTSLVGQTSVTISGIDQSYEHLYVTALDVYGSTSPVSMVIKPNNYAYWRVNGFYSSTTTFNSFADNTAATGLTANVNQIRYVSANASERTHWIFWLYNYSETYPHKMFYLQKSGYDNTNGFNNGVIEGASQSGFGNNAITSLVVSITGGATFSAGDLQIWGLK
jgi:hypothetical protein